MADVIHGWLCVGCGRVEVVEPCIGECSDRRVDLVTASDYYRVVERAERAERECRQLRAMLGQSEAAARRESYGESLYEAM